jgi:hypothetical protein
MSNNTAFEQEIEERWVAEVEARQVYAGYQGLWQRLLRSRRSQEEPSYPFPDDFQVEDDEEQWTGTER